MSRQARLARAAELTGRAIWFHAEMDRETHGAALEYHVHAEWWLQVVTA